MNKHLKTFPLKALIGTALGMSIPAVGWSAPLAFGNTLTWPDDGWYQVQNADTFETVCEGGRSCAVLPGVYNVINHTTAERFEGIQISASSSETNNDQSGVQVSGQTISWPDDGWYQVQRQSDFITVCEGTASCVVENGNYIVINHTTGERFSDIAVGSGGADSDTGTVSDAGGNGSTQPARVELNGTTIRWPDDGWYQVQDLSDFSTICEGGQECRVADGDFVVINHSTGERTEITVSADALADAPVAQSEFGDTVLINFGITVPAYMSNELKVELTWGDLRFDAAWAFDETWEANADFPINTSNQLTITFFDRNGGIALASYEQLLAIGTTEQTIDIGADQLDSNRWDDDADGVSNLEELRAGSDPLTANSGTVVADQEPPAGEPTTGQQTAFDLLDASEELMEELAGFQLDRMTLFVGDLWYQAGQQTTIQWPNDDYYQVQHPADGGRWADFAGAERTVCEGGPSCRILPGEYIQINHTTGERSELIVPYRGVDEVPHAIQLPDIAGPVTIERTQYNCELGGSVVREFSDDEAPQSETPLINSSAYDLVGLRDRRTTIYRFNQCRITINTSFLSAGTYLVDGVAHDSYTTHRFTNFQGIPVNTVRRAFDSFSVVSDDGAEFRVDGEVERYSELDDFNFQYIRRAVISEYTKLAPGGQIEKSVNDVRYEQVNHWNGSFGEGYHFRSDRASGHVRSARTGNQLVLISTEPAFTSRRLIEDYSGSQTDLPFTGNMEMISDDGSLLFIMANLFQAPGEIFQRWASFDFTPPTGNRVARTARFLVPWHDGRLCEGQFSFTRAFRDRETRRIYCDSSGVFLEL